MGNTREENFKFHICPRPRRYTLFERNLISLASSLKYTFGHKTLKRFKTDRSELVGKYSLISMWFETSSSWSGPFCWHLFLEVLPDMGLKVFFWKPLNSLIKWWFLLASTASRSLPLNFRFPKNIFCYHIAQECLRIAGRHVVHLKENKFKLQATRRHSIQLPLCSDPEVATSKEGPVQVVCTSGIYSSPALINTLDHSHHTINQHDVLYKRRPWVAVVFATCFRVLAGSCMHGYLPARLVRMSTLNVRSPLNLVFSCPCEILG